MNINDNYLSQQYMNITTHCVLCLCQFKSYRTSTWSWWWCANFYLFI